MGLVFVPKILFIRKHAHDPRLEREEDKKEEERRYKEVVKENELLQKKVQEVSDYCLRSQNAPQEREGNEAVAKSGHQTASLQGRNYGRC